MSLVYKKSTDETIILLLRQYIYCWDSKTIVETVSLLLRQFASNMSNENNVLC